MVWIGGRSLAFRICLLYDCPGNFRLHIRPHCAHYRQSLRRPNLYEHKRGQHPARGGQNDLQLLPVLGQALHAVFPSVVAHKLSRDGPQRPVHLAVVIGVAVAAAEQCVLSLQEPGGMSSRPVANATRPSIGSWFARLRRSSPQR